MLIPPALHDGRGWEYVVGSFHPYKPKYLFGKYGQIKRWAYKHGKHLGKGYSDHLPIVARFSTEGTANGSAKQSSPSLWDKISDWFTAPHRPSTVDHPLSTINQTRLESRPLTRHPSPLTTIEKLKHIPHLTTPVRLDNVHVLFKRRESAVIQQTPEGEAILLYRSALQLEEGHCYDLRVHKTKRYKGLPEVTDVEMERDLGSCDAQSFIPKFAPAMLDQPHFVGRVVRAIHGRYTHHTLMVDGVPCILHIRRGAGRPKSGVKLRIDRAQIGYYKDHVELVIWDRKDYKIRN